MFAVTVALKIFLLCHLRLAKSKSVPKNRCVLKILTKVASGWLVLKVPLSAWKHSFQKKLLYTEGNEFRRIMLRSWYREKIFTEKCRWMYKLITEYLGKYECLEHLRNSKNTLEVKEASSTTSLSASCCICHGMDGLCNGLSCMRESIM